MYAVGPAFQYLVFPQQTGTLTIPSVSFTCDVAQKDDAIDEVDAFFNGGGMINKKVQVTSAANQLRVFPFRFQNLKTSRVGWGSSKLRPS